LQAQQLTDKDEAFATRFKTTPSVVRRVVGSAEAVPKRASAATTARLMIRCMVVRK